MKFGTFSVLFAGIVIAFFMLFNNTSIIGDVYSNARLTRGKAIERSSFDAAEANIDEAKKTGYSLDNGNLFFNTDSKRQKAVNTTLESYADGIGVSDETKLSEYIPVIMLADYDGYYVDYTNISSSSETGQEIVRTETPIRLWNYAGEYAIKDVKGNIVAGSAKSQYVTRFYMGDYVVVTDRTTQGNPNQNVEYSGKYTDVAKQIGETKGWNDVSQFESAGIGYLTNQKNFELVRNNVIVTSLQKDLMYYTNTFNQVMRNSGTDAASYNITLGMAKKLLDTAGNETSSTKRLIDNPTVFVFMQSANVDNALGNINLYGLSASEISKKHVYIVRKYNVHTDSGDRIVSYYHLVGASRDDSCAIGVPVGEKKIYYSEEDAAKTGALPCPYCVTRERPAKDAGNPDNTGKLLLN